MKTDYLIKHKFQFISFCYIYHPLKRNFETIQLNNDSHIIHITKGIGRVTIEGQHHKIKAGNVISIPPFTPFSFAVSDGFEMMNIHYKMWMEDDTLLDNRKRLPLIFAPAYFIWCKTMLFKMKSSRQNELPDPTAHEIVLRHLAENQLTDVACSCSDPQMLKVKKHLKNPGLSRFQAKELEKISCLGKSQINRKFKALFAVSPQKYWEKQRLKNICLILKSSSAAIYEIATMTGFSDQGYFCRWFKKMTGHSPSEYRKNLSENDEQF